MEALFRKQFWVVHLLFLAANAFLLARAGNQFVAWWISMHGTSGVQPEEARTAPPLPPRARGLGELPEKGNMFRVAPEDVSAAAADDTTGSTTRPDPSGEPVATSLRIRLAGVTWFDVAEWSLAAISDLGTHETALYSVNMCAPRKTVPTLEAGEEEDVSSKPRPPPCNQLLADATILRIEPDRVVFLNRTAGRREYIDLSDEENKAAASPVTASAAPVPSKAESNETPPSAGELGKGITKVAENQYKVPQSDVDEVVANLNTVATQARIVPSFEGGKANGFKLFSIRPGSVYTKIGIQNGDVINRINGYEITSPDKALEVYSKLQNSKEITVDVTRRGQKVTMSYGIQ
jgi:general secretion pathway protein C